MAWKERKLKEKRDKADDAMLKRKEAFKAGRTHGVRDSSSLLWEVI